MSDQNYFLLYLLHVLYFGYFVQIESGTCIEICKRSRSFPNPMCASDPRKWLNLCTGFLSIMTLGNKVYQNVVQLVPNWFPVYNDCRK